MTHSVDFRQKVLDIRKWERLSYAEVATRFEVSVSSVFRLSICPDSKRTHSQHATKIDMVAYDRTLNKIQMHTSVNVPKIWVRTKVR